VPNIVRVEGITELLGDLILNCTGGKPTPAGTAIPLQNVVVQLANSGVNITSRIVGSTTAGTPTYDASEALLLIDEPFPTGHATGVGAVPDVINPPTMQAGCLAINNTNCAITVPTVGSYTGIGGSGPYNGQTFLSGSTSTTYYNVFQGVQITSDSISWSGVPIDAPGTTGTRVIRITNIRANMVGQAIGTQISMNISVNGSQLITITPSTASVVGRVEQGLVPSIATAGTYEQCNSVNTYLLSPAPSNPVTTDSGIAVSATEGFPYAFRPQNYVQMTPSGTYTLPGGTLLPQDVLNYPYSTESAFTPYLANASASGFTFVDDTNTLSGTSVGIASQGTQITFSVTGVTSGVSLYAPSYVYLSGAYGTGTVVGVAVLLNSIGGYPSTPPPVLLQGGTPVAATPMAVNSAGGTTASFTYEIIYANPSVQETLSVPISVAYLSNTASNLPGTTATGAATQAAVGFYPISTVTTATPTDPIPRFGPSYPPSNLFTIASCTCNLLFPFVSNVPGFNTGVAIANTSDDPFGTTPQTGTVTLWYYGTNVPAMSPVTTTAPIAAGQTLTFDLMGGNSGLGIAPATGFQGYIIAQTNFQYCHGFAFISNPQVTFAEGYLAISLDLPVVTVEPLTCTTTLTGQTCSNSPTGLNRTGIGGETQGN